MPSKQTAYSAILTTKIRKSLEIRKFDVTFAALLKTKGQPIIKRASIPK